VDALTHVFMGLEVLTSPSNLSLVLIFLSSIKWTCAFVFLLCNVVVVCMFYDMQVLFLFFFGCFLLFSSFFMFQFLKSMTE
jgi:hypothetical protein